jgi:hypothetical protein
MSDLVAVALAQPAGGTPPGPDLGAALAQAADERTRDLVDGFVHQAGPPPGRFAWVALGSHARGELHCASDQDHALIWDTDRAAASSYADDLAAEVIAGLAEFGMRPCDGGYMADRWSVGLADWVLQARHRIDAPTPEAVVEPTSSSTCAGSSGTSTSPPRSRSTSGVRTPRACCTGWPSPPRRSPRR